MAECRICKQQVEFKPHPKNPHKVAPFDADGQIHFARCKQGKPKTEYASLDVFGTCGSSMPRCTLPIKFAAEFIISNGESRLVVMCAKGHKRQIHDTPNNRKLINRPRVVAQRAECVGLP